MNREPVQEPRQQNRPNEEPSLKGTLVSVLCLGTFIVVCWAAAFTLFLSRQ